MAARAVAELSLVGRHADNSPAEGEFRDLRRAFAQSLALIVISLLGVSSFIALIGAFRDLGTSYNNAYQQLKFADVTFALNGAPQAR